MPTDRMSVEEVSIQEIHGFDHDFDPEVDRKYQCPICLAVLREAVQTSCGHRFCEECLKGVIKYAPVVSMSGGSNLNLSLRARTCAKCPVDNRWFRVRGEVFPDNATRREVLSLTVKCDHNKGDDRCQWKGELRELQDHKDACQMAPLPCEYNCGLTVTRGEAVAHMASCRRRPVACDHCHITLALADRPMHHLLECEKFPVTCTVCGAVGILRKNIPDHIEQDCPLVEVRCTFHRLGCKAEEKRQNLEKHNKDYWQQHLALMAENELHLRSEMQKFRITVESLTNDVEDLKGLAVRQEVIMKVQRRHIQRLRGESNNDSVSTTSDDDVADAGTNTITVDMDEDSANI
ncbi:TNF receptor-associated factor 6-like isoform X1 [Haliotis rufescens]|uniref:TNF receptor-associated factor 6-like isoform X1 n=2 Tax=Haliotis rufescens TaxID=6454 RepID=UPI001EB01AD2|nr:TNF receptor-associated factor 6-like isoform X1 [Haliotis rufescens]